MSIPVSSDSYYFNLGRRIQVRRKDLGLTQEQLAEQTNSSITHISRVERGTKPSIDLLIRLCFLLEYSMDDLLDIPHRDNQYLDECISLFLLHSLKSQQMVLQMVRCLFQILDAEEKAEAQPSAETENCLPL